MVTPLDIRRKEFRHSVRGYLEEDVDVFLDAVADEVERISKLNAELQDRMKSLEEQVEGHAVIRNALEKTLVAAQLQSDEIRSKAQKESQSLLRDAEEKAKAVVEEFYEKTRVVQQTLMQLKLLEEDFRFKLKGMLEGYLTLVDKGPLLADEGTRKAKPKAAAKTAVPRTQQSDERAPGLGEGSTTSETIEGFGLSTEESARPGGKSSRPAPLPPRLPKAEMRSRTATALDEDLTVETKGSAMAGPGVYSAKADTDADEPFPELGTGAAEPRDFAW